MGMDMIFNNYCLNFQSPGGGLVRSNPIFKPKGYKQMTAFGIFPVTINNTIPIFTYSYSSYQVRSSHHQPRSQKSAPYNHSQQFYQKSDTVQSFPLEIPLEEEETHFDACSSDPAKLEFGLETERVRDRDGGPISEESLELEMDRIRPRRQMMKRSTMIAKQVISIQSALNLGFVSQLWVDTTSWTVLIVEVRPSLLSGEVERLFLGDIAKVGDVLLIEDESVMENNFKLLGLETLVGYTVVTPGRRSIGKVRGYTFDINSGAVESLELDSFGISIIPSSLVSTYGLYVEDVVEVSGETVVVDEAAASRIQRLTKGFWGASVKKMRNRNRYGGGDDESESEFEGYSEERRKRELFGRKKKVEEEWELPMDYL